MISNRQIRDALAVLIKERAGLALKVYFNQVHNAEDDYAWIQLKSERTDEGWNLFVRRVRVDIQVVLAPLTAQVKHTDLLDIADALDEATHGYIRVADRAVTVYETAAHIFDGVLHYEFLLEFADGIQSLPEEVEEYSFGESLAINLKTISPVPIEPEKDFADDEDAGNIIEDGWNHIYDAPDDVDAVIDSMWTSGGTSSTDDDGFINYLDDLFN